MTNTHSIDMVSMNTKEKNSIQLNVRGESQMKRDLDDFYDDSDYMEEEDVDLYSEFKQKKMTKKEFIREMLRLQEERRLYQDN